MCTIQVQTGKVSKVTFINSSRGSLGRSIAGSWEFVHLYTCLVGLQSSNICEGLWGWGCGGGAALLRWDPWRSLRTDPTRAVFTFTANARLSDSASVPLPLQLGSSRPRLSEHSSARGVSNFGSASPPFLQMMRSSIELPARASTSDCEAAGFTLWVWEEDHSHGNVLGPSCVVKEKMFFCWSLCFGECHHTPDLKPMTPYRISHMRDIIRYHTGIQS